MKSFRDMYISQIHFMISRNDFMISRIQFTISGNRFVISWIQFSNSWYHEFNSWYVSRGNIANSIGWLHFVICATWHVSVTLLAGRNSWYVSRDAYRQFNWLIVFRDMYHVTQTSGPKGCLFFVESMFCAIIMVNGRQSSLAAANTLLLIYNFPSRCRPFNS